MAVQFDYLAEKGWKPKNPDENYVITLIKVELDEEAVKEAEYHQMKKGEKKFYAPEIAQPQEVASDISELKKRGFNSKISVEEGIKRTFEWYKLCWISGIISD